VYVASIFNERGLFQHLNGWVSQADGEAQARRQVKADQVYFRATSVLLALDRMVQLDEACVQEYGDFEVDADVKDDRIIFWSPRLVGILNELPSALSALRIMQNAVLPTLAAGRDKPVSVASSLHEAVKKAHQIALPEPLKNRVLDYWHRGGNRLKEYRDVDQHFGAVVHHTFLQVKPPRRVIILLPDNPEARRSDDFTFSGELNAFDFVRDSFDSLHGLFEDMARLEGAAPKPLGQNVEAGQLGELTEGVQKTLAVIVEANSPNHALILGQTEDRRMTVKEAFRIAPQSREPDGGS